MDIFSVRPMHHVSHPSSVSVLFIFALNVLKHQVFFTRILMYIQVGLKGTRPAKDLIIIGKRHNAWYNK